MLKVVAGQNWPVCAASKPPHAQEDVCFAYMRHCSILSGQHVDEGQAGLASFITYQLALFKALQAGPDGLCCPAHLHDSCSSHIRTIRTRLGLVGQVLTV
jgi:hypothetical protein